MNFIEKAGWKFLNSAIWCFGLYGIATFKFLLSFEMLGMWFVSQTISLISRLLVESKENDN